MLVFIISVGLVVLLYALMTILYKRTNAYKNQFVTIKDYLRGVPDDLEFVILGSTYMKYAFNSISQLRIKGFNFSLEAESLQCDEKILEQYASRMRPGCTVIIGVAACVALCDEKDLISRNYNCYYKIFDYEHLPKIQKKSIKYRISYMFPVRLRNIKQFFRIIKDTKPLNDIIEKWPSLCNNFQAIKNMDGMAQGWINMFHLKDLKNPDLPASIKEKLELNVSTLIRMVNFCREHSFRPVIVIPPFSKYLNQHFSEEFVDSSLIQIINKVQETCGVLVLNYWDADDFRDELSLFVDGGFRMSEYGSLKFMRMVIKDLNSHGFKLNNANIARPL